MNLNFPIQIQSGDKYEVFVFTDNSKFQVSKIIDAQGRTVIPDDTIIESIHTKVEVLKDVLMSS